MHRVIAWALWIAALVGSGVIGALVLLFPDLTRDQPEAISVAIFFGAITFVAMTFATAGLLILRQRRTHAVGWLMLSGGSLLSGVFASFLVGYALYLKGSPAAGWVMLPGVVVFGPAIFVLGPAVALLFPDGRLPSDRWRWPFAVAVSAIGVSSIAAVVRPGPLEAGIPVDNPLGIAGLPRQVADLLVELFVPAVSAAGLAAAVALIVRYRRAGPVERQQLKWFISAVTAWAAVLPFAFVANTNVLAIVALTALALVPISVVIAILRYRLYEIDTLINRTLVYVPLVGIVAGLYAGCVALLQRAFVAVTGDTSDAAAVISALILAAVFTPIRNSLQSVVDARFKAASSGDPPSAPDRSEPALGAAIQSLVARMDRTEVKMETYLSEHGRIHEDLTSAFARVEERLVTSTGQPMPREDAPIGEGRSTAPGPVPLSPDSQNDGSSRTRTRRGTSDG